MLILTSARAIRHATTYCAQSVPVHRLNHYAVLLDTEPIGWLFIIQPGDTLALLDALRGRPLEGAEFIDLESGWYEAVFILSDDGFGHIVFAPDQPDIDPELRDLLT